MRSGTDAGTLVARSKEGSVLLALRDLQDRAENAEADLLALTDRLVGPVAWDAGPASPPLAPVGQVQEMLACSARAGKALENLRKHVAILEDNL